MTRNILSERSHRLTDENLNAKKIVKSAVKARTKTTCCFDHDISSQKYHDDWNDSYVTEQKEGHEKCTVSSQSEHEVSGREVNETEVELTGEQLIWSKRNKRHNEDKETGTSAKKKRDKESQNEKVREKESQNEKEIEKNSKKEKEREK